MALLSLQDVCFTYSHPPLLEDISLEIHAGERIGLLGRNGMGKSTLMKIMAGEIKPDHGRILAERNLCVARLVQEVPEGYDGRIADVVAEGLVTATMPHDTSRSESAPLQEFDDPWRASQAVDRVLSRMKLRGSDTFHTLSSGMKRRALLARALVRDPDILLLDEPTNHLDIDAIRWLERFLKGYDGTLVFVTHDRVFLQTLATRILEIDRGRIFDWTCDYTTFLTRKQAALAAEAMQNAHFDRKLAQEEVWIRQGIKARRTRNEGRVKALKKMRVERQGRRERMGSVRMRAVAAEKSGQMVIEAQEISYDYGGATIVDNFSTLITRGEKIGIIGPNGTGKTTLLKLLLGQLPPTSGNVRHGTRLEVLYFDQLREQIDEQATVAENVGQGQEHLSIHGKQKHILGYLQEFLFTPDRSRQLAKFLSGGERNRLLLARLFKRPSNVMVLDEPTNDLDAETLELLEELVADYEGTLLLVSHDRAFLNNVVTSTLVLDGSGQIKQYDGGYDDFLRQQQDANVSDATNSAASKTTASNSKGTRMESTLANRVEEGVPEKLAYREQRELEGLPAQIEQLEQEQSELHAAMADPQFFKRGGTEIAAATSRMETISAELERHYARWEELEVRK